MKKKKLERTRKRLKGTGRSEERKRDRVVNEIGGSLTQSSEEKREREKEREEDRGR